MMYAILSGVGFAIMLVLGVVFAVIAVNCRARVEYDMEEYHSEDRKKEDHKKIKHYTTLLCVCSVIAIVGFLLLLCIPGSIHQIEAGEVAVVKHMGQVSATEGPGISFRFWMTDKYEKYDAKVQSMEIEAQAYSSDAQIMDITMTVQYSIDQSKVKEIASQYGNLDAVAQKLEKVAIERTKSTLSEKSAMGIIETRATVSPEVETAVKAAVDSSYYVTVHTVVLTNIDFSDAFEATVEQKMIAEQEQLKAKYEKEKAIIKAEQDLEVAKKAADAQLYKANQDAEAKKAIALAEAVSTSSKIAKLAESLGYDVKVNYVQETRTEKVLVDTPKLDADGNVMKDDKGQVITEKKEVEQLIMENGKAKLFDTDIVAGYEVDWKTADAPDGGQATILDYLKYLEYLSTWNGELPDVVAGENGFMITLPAPTTPSE